MNLVREMRYVSGVLQCRGYEADAQRMRAMADDTERRGVTENLETRMILLTILVATGGARCTHRRETMRYLAWARRKLAEEPESATRILMVLDDIREEMRRPCPIDHLQRRNLA